MPVHIEWDNEEETILRWDFAGDWTWDEVFKMRTHSNRLIGQKPYPVDVIVNVVGDPFIPEKIISTYKLLQPHLKAPPNMGSILVVGCNGALRAVILTFNVISPLFQLVDSIEEARSMLNRQ